MNHKALVEISLPASGQRFEVYIPLDSTIWQITSLVSAALSDLSGGKFFPTADTVLCDGITGQVLDINMEAGELGLCNGSCLMLI